MNKPESKPTTSELRKFAMLISAVTFLGGLVLLIKDRHNWMALIATAILFCVTGFFRPGLLGGIYRYWMKFSEVMGRFMTAVILVSFFFLVVTPIGVVGRLSGKKSLSCGFESSSKSYWKERTDVDESGRSLERQF